MTTQRHNRRGDDDVALHGSHVHPHTTIATADVTTLLNAVLRGEFAYPDGTPVRLKAGPRVALYALLTYHRDRADPAWRLDMDRFVREGFAEKKTTVYGWIRVLEETGFVVRRRVNSPATGAFEWHLDVADRPGILRGAPEKPQVTPSVQKGGDGVAPPVDNSKTAGQPIPMKTHDGENPLMGFPAHGHFLREITTKELPASPPVPATRATAEAVEGDQSRSEQPTLSLVRPTARTADEDHLAADGDWQDWVLALLDHPAVRAAAPLRPTAHDVELVAIRAQVAAEQLGWTRKQLAERVLLVRLGGVQHLGSVWCARLHPQTLGAPPVAGRKTEVERGRLDRDAMPPSSPERIAEIRQLHGAPRGTRWRELGGGS